MVREGLARIINQKEDLTVCGEATNAAEALKQIKTLAPKLVITDIAVKGTNGFDFAKSLRAQFPKMRLLVFSTQPESLHAERAIQAGANGYVMKEENSSTVLSAIRQVLEGKTYISSDVNQQILQKLSKANGKTSPIRKYS